MNISEEIIDSFVRGDLSGADLEAFNKALTADPKLQQEVSFQKDIVDSIKNYKHQQLKSRLNAIEIKPAGFFSSPYIKLAASIGVVALLTGGFVLFTKQNSPENSIIASASENTINTISENTQSAIVASKTETNATAVESSPLAKKSNENNSTSKKTTASASSSTTSYPEPSEAEMDEDFTIAPANEDVTMPTSNDGSTSISSPQIKVSIVKEEKNLGYRFFNNQLYLHGNFSNSTYELFELNNKPSKQLFLYFENNYYELIQGKTKITALSPITDKATLLQLTQLREH